MIVDFVKQKRRDVTRWQDLRFWIGLLGAVTWFEVELARAVMQGSWKDVIFPAWLSLISIITHSHITPLLSLHSMTSLILFRTLMIHPNPSKLHIACFAVEIVYCIAMLGLPYHENLDRLLEGAKSKGGGSLGSFGSKLPKHCEEPACEFILLSVYDVEADIRSSRMVSRNIQLYASPTFQTLSYSHYAREHPSYP